MRNFRGPALDTFCERTSYQMPKPITGPGSTTGTDSVEPQNHRATREIPRQDDDPKPMSDVTFTEAQQRISNVANNPASLQAFYQQIASDTVKGSNRPLPLRPDQSNYNVLGSKINRITPKKPKFWAAAPIWYAGLLITITRSCI
jgi:hypothetical protein